MKALLTLVLAGTILLSLSVEAVGVPKSSQVYLTVSGRVDKKMKYTCLPVRVVDPKDDFSEGSNALDDQVAAENTRYSHLKWTRLSGPLWTQDCAGYVLEKNWGTAKYKVSAPILFKNVVKPFGYPVPWYQSYRPGDVVVWMQDGDAQHVAYVTNAVFRKAGVIIETKDNEESVFRGMLVPDAGTGLVGTDPLGTRYTGTPVIWRLPRSLKFTVCTQDQCGKEPAGESQVSQVVNSDDQVVGEPGAQLRIYGGAVETQPAPRPALASVASASGAANLRRPGSDPAALSAGLDVSDGDVVRTGSSASVTLALGDGSATVESGSELELADLSGRALLLASGGVRVREAGSRVGVHTPTATIRAQGTEFTVRYNEETETTTVTVQQGSVVATPVNGTLRPVTVQAGNKVTVSPQNVTGGTTASGPVPGSGTSTPGSGTTTATPGGGTSTVPPGSGTTTATPGSGTSTVPGDGGTAATVATSQPITIYTIFNVSGPWLSVARPGDAPRSVTVEQKGRELILLMDDGTSSSGFMMPRRSILAREWEDGLVGHLSEDRMSVEWENGMVWRRPQGFRDLGPLPNDLPGRRKAR